MMQIKTHEYIYCHKCGEMHEVEHIIDCCDDFIDSEDFVKSFSEAYERGLDAKESE